MKSTTIRQLKHETTTVLGWVARGESVEVRRRDELVALLSPPAPTVPVRRPDFAARLAAIYGPEILPTTGTDLVAAARGES